MSAKAQLRRVNALSYRFKKIYLGSYVVLSEVDADGHELSFWDGMKSRPTTREEIERLASTGWEVVIREFPALYVGGPTD